MDNFPYNHCDRCGGEGNFIRRHGIREEAAWLCFPCHRDEPRWHDQYFDNGQYIG